MPAVLNRSAEPAFSCPFSRPGSICDRQDYLLVILVEVPRLEPRSPSEHVPPLGPRRQYAGRHLFRFEHRLKVEIELHAGEEPDELRRGLEGIPGRQEGGKLVEPERPHPQSKLRLAVPHARARDRIQSELAVGSPEPRQAFAVEPEPLAGELGDARAYPE